MRFPTFDEAEDLKLAWTDKYVRMKPGFAEYRRFEGKIGRVVTVNYSGMAIVDFADGAWYDIPASEDYLTPLAADDPNRSKYDSTANSAQARPERKS